MNRIVQAPLYALGVGALGFAGNMLELQLGWGMHFLFGNALVYAFIRVLPPAGFVTATSVASAWTIMLWNHPWAWALWTMEAAIVAIFVDRTSPIRADFGFWLILGAPLLVISYGGIMGMDELSLSLTITKQAINGILNTALGELLYTLGLTLLVRGRARPLAKLPIESFVLMLMVATILMPTVIYLSFDATRREQTARVNAARILDDQLQLAAEALALWRDTRADSLQSFADLPLPMSTGTALLPLNLRRDFQKIELGAASNRQLSANRIPVSDTARAQLLLLPSTRPDGSASLALTMPQGGAPNATHIVGVLRERTLADFITRMRLSEATIVLRAPNAARIPLQQVGQDSARIIGLSEHDLAKALEGPVLLSRTGYGNALMSDLKDAALLRAVTLRNQSDWQVVGMVGLSKAVLEERRAQLNLFLTLATLLALVIVVGSLLANRVKGALRTLTQSAADLAMSGANRTTIDHMVIRELSDLSINLATVGSTVAEERGALISYQRRLGSISRNAPIVVYTLDIADRRAARFSYLSDAIGKLLGFTQDEAAQSAWWRSVVHPDDYLRCLEAFDSLSLGQPVSHEYRLRHKQGHYIWVYDTLALEPDQQHERTEPVGLILDISDRRRAAEQLIQADKMASLGRMVAGVAHELNQPLNFIKLAANNLRERTMRGMFDIERYAAKFEAIIAHTDRAAAIILQMRMFGWTSAEAAGPMRIKASCENLHILIGSQLEADGIVLDTSGCDPELEVHALPVHIEQVLLNLLLNARDAILCKRLDKVRHPGFISIGAHHRNGRSVITVSDNGSGIPEHILPILFEPFFTTKPPRQGTGLGLSISYGIIRDLGGTIEATNTMHGALFTIDLPGIA